MAGGAGLVWLVEPKGLKRAIVPNLLKGKVPSLGEFEHDTHTSVGIFGCPLSNNFNYVLIMNGPLCALIYQISPVLFLEPQCSCNRNYLPASAYRNISFLTVNATLIARNSPNENDINQPTIS